MGSVFGVPQFGQSPAPFVALPGCDVANCIQDVWFRLGFLNYADMAVDDRWVTLAELYRFGDDAAKRLSYMLGLFMSYDTSIAVLAGTAAYTLPAAHVFTVLAWMVYAGLPLQLLRPSTAGQLFALDANWPTTTGNPTRFSLDAGGPGSCTLYPAPVSPGTLAQVIQGFPADVVSGSSSLPVSPVLQDYFTYCLLAGARGKESDSALPEMAAHFRERVKLYEQVMEHLWGPGV